jgi:hypothetical protein
MYGEKSKWIERFRKKFLSSPTFPKGGALPNAAANPNPPVARPLRANFFAKERTVLLDFQALFCQPLRNQPTG